MSASMARTGELSMGIATLLSFECYLRVSEMLQLVVSDIVLPGEERRAMDGSHATTALPGLRLAHTKTSSNLYVSIRIPALCTLLAALVHGRARTERVFPFTRAAYYVAFHASLRALGVSGIRFVPHSNRHGGATADHMRGVPIEDIQYRGRWKSNDSARLYIQQGQAMLLVNQVPPEAMRIGARVAADLAASMSRCEQQYEGEST